MPKGKAKAAARIGKAIAMVAISRTLETGKPTIDQDALLNDQSLERQGQKQPDMKKKDADRDRSH